MFEMGGGWPSVENVKSLESMRNIVGSVFIYVGLTERHYRTISSIVSHTIQLNLPLLTALLSVREIKRCTVEIRKTQSQKRHPKSGVYLIYATGSHLRFLYLVRKTQLIPLNPFSTNPQMGHRPATTAAASTLFHSLLPSGTPGSHRKKPLPHSSGRNIYEHANSERTRTPGGASAT